MGTFAVKVPFLAKIFSINGFTDLTNLDLAKSVNSFTHSGKARRCAGVRSPSPDAAAAPAALAIAVVACLPQTVRWVGDRFVMLSHCGKNVMHACICKKNAYNLLGNHDANLNGYCGIVIV